jgi:hypothetical protein
LLGAASLEPRFRVRVEDFQNLAILGQDLDGSLVPIASIALCHPGHLAAPGAAASDWPLPFGIWLSQAATSRIDYLNKLGGLPFARAFC